MRFMNMQFRITLIIEIIIINIYQLYKIIYETLSKHIQKKRNAAYAAGSKRVGKATMTEKS